MSSISSRLHLFLLRHAKSAWDDPAVDDHDRPLSPRGEAAALAMGQAMYQRGYKPDRVLCSPALRAQQTWALAARQWPSPPAARTIAELYDFGDGAALREVIAAHAHDAEALLLVGHNPSIENFALWLAGSGDETARRRLAAKYPTAALCVFAVEGGWNAMRQGSGRLDCFLRPRDLT